MNGRSIVIDTETTGLSPEHDEILQVSIIDSAGNILFDSLFRPSVSSWEEAEKINGISPDMVANAPRLIDRIHEITEIMYKSDKIIGYNTSFDLNFLRNNGLVLHGTEEIIDVMNIFAPIYGEWSYKRNSWKWQKLTTAAAYYGYDWSSRTEGAHNSLGDCFATLYVYEKLKEEA